MAKFSYRNSVHATTKHTPFEANYGYHPADPSTPDTPVSAVPAASAHLKNLHTIHHDPVTNIKNAQATHAKFYNKRVKEISGQEGGPVFKVGDMVFFNRKNIKTLRPALKLDYRMLGPYKIIEATSSPLAFKLDLPPKMDINPVFHVSLLEPLRSGHLSRSHIEQRRQKHVFANYRRESHITGRPKTATRVLSASLRSEPQDCRDSPFAPLQRSRRDVWKTRHGTQSYGSI
jgi:hypothetical protein